MERLNGVVQQAPDQPHLVRSSSHRLLQFTQRIPQDDLWRSQGIDGIGSDHRTLHSVRT